MQSNAALFDRMGVKIVVASADDETGARKMAEEQGLKYPVGYSLGADQIESLEAISGIRNDAIIVQPTEFVLNPQGIIAASMYSSTQLGRMNPREVLQFLKSRIG